MANKNNQFCYMCGKSVNEVNKLIKGEYGYICDSCISIASDLLNDEEEESITNNMQLATPSQIKAHSVTGIIKIISTIGEKVNE